MSWGDVMDALVVHIARGKGYDKMSEGGWPSDWRERAEAEINAMSNIELLMLLEAAGLLVVPA